MRIGGLASGMDIDSLVSDLMKAERIPLDKMHQKKQTLEWQRDNYREMNSLLFSLRTEVANMKYTSKYRARQVTSSNESKITATASTAAGTASYAISEVNQLASAASKVSTASVSNGTKIDTTKGLYEIKGNFANNSFNWRQGSVESETMAVDADGTSFSLKMNAGANVQVSEAANMVVKVDGKAYTIVTSGAPGAGEVNIDSSGQLTFGDTIQKGSTIKVNYMTDVRVDDEKTLSAATKEIQLQKGSIADGSLTLDIDGTTYTNVGNEIQDASGNKVGTIDAQTGKITMDNEMAKDSVIKATYQQNYFTFGMTTYDENGDAINESFAIQGNESLDTVIKKVNESSAGVSMFYDSFSDKVTLTRTETGNFNGTESDEEIVLSGSFLNDVLNFNGASEIGGKNAKFTMNGLATERTSNTFSVSGVTFTLKDTFATSDATVTVSISNDSDKVVENIKNFVEKYNETIEKIQKKLSEERYRDYLPLTDEQKEAMSEKHIELWEEKAKSGLLRRDSILSGALSQMRTDFYQPVTNDSVSSKFNQLASIGITTSPNYLDGGKLIINEATLKEAIEEDPESIEELFRGNGDDYNEKGIMQRMYDSITNTMDKINEKAGKTTSAPTTYTLGKNLNDLDKRIDRFEDRLIEIEDRYWRQFTAMEKVIQRTNQQSMYLMQQFGGF
ncbi:flagellar filament capping protein FliD [Bacillus sp. FJAT-47783]|uniref:flagellar filament capping protein FliD n=1 Tax=Bacillus sp. FJAT-47783 TaxID=2922712 RepID=UPI001FAC9701|nr:flagellar filament capping protein FliD [Bacillus sp. FJAT-47783]